MRYCGIPLRLGFFEYNNNNYPSGTKVLYNGVGFLNDKEILLSNVVVEFLYQESGWCFKYNNNIYRCKDYNYEKYIVKIIYDKQNDMVQRSEVNKHTAKEVVWTDGMVTATLWYVFIMLFGTIFYARIGIWIFATIIWWNYIQKNKIEIRR